MLLGIGDDFVGVGRKFESDILTHLLQIYIPNRKLHIRRELMKPTHLVSQLGNVSLARSLSNHMCEQFHLVVSYFCLVSPL